VNALLVHLETHDFPAPRPLGIDDEGRQVVSWLPGETSWLDHARHWGSVARLRAAARLVRHLHDVLDQFVPPGGAVGRGGWDRDTGGQGPICHHDLAPWNVIVAPDRSLAVIDWEGAGPGDRLAEVAYAIHGFVPLRRDSECARLGWREPPDRASRIEAFFGAYGFSAGDRDALADALVVCGRGGVAFGEQMYREGREPFASWWAADMGAGDRADLAATEAAVCEWLTLR